MSPLDTFKSLFEQGVDDKEIAAIAEVPVAEVKKYRAKLKAEATAAATAAETDAATAADLDSADPASPTIPAPVVKTRPTDLITKARTLVMEHPGRLVVRLTRGFNLNLTSPRTGKPATHPVQQSDYKDAMAVHVVRLAVETGNTDAIILMDPSSEGYPPNP